MPRYSFTRSPWTRTTSARRLVRACEQRAGHDRVRSGGDRLGDVAGGREPAVGDQRHAVLGGDLGALVDGGDLRYADARNHRVVQIELCTIALSAMKLCVGQSTSRS